MIIVFVSGLQGAGAAPLVSEVDAAVSEAAETFHLPPQWIRRVIAAESGGDPRAVSRAGALGLMQLMPGTWRDLRGRLGLGPDPFDVHDNVLAGAAYLRRMLDAFGAPGFLGAYNAGPSRYADYLAGRGPLPAETRDYMARLGADLGSPTHLHPARGDWRRAELFVSSGSDRGEATGVSSPTSHPQR